MIRRVGDDNILPLTVEEADIVSTQNSEARIDVARKR